MKRVLFLCIGNSCRSQMAEGFARKYGTDVMEPQSAGFSPASIVQPLTKKVMEDKNIKIDDQFPKDLGRIDIQNLDLIVNMSARPLPANLPIAIKEWKVEDPIGQGEEVYVAVRDRIEHAVMRLVLDLRREKRNAQGSTEPRPVVRRPRRAAN